MSSANFINLKRFCFGLHRTTDDLKWETRLIWPLRVLELPVAAIANLAEGTLAGSAVAFIVWRVLTLAFNVGVLNFSFVKPWRNSVLDNGVGGVAGKTFVLRLGMVKIWECGAHCELHWYYHQVLTHSLGVICKNIYIDDYYWLSSLCKIVARLLLYWHSIELYL